MLQSHFVALLTYVSEKDGGRKTPASSGYRPTIKFTYIDGEFSGVQHFIDTDLVFAGDTVSAEITLINTDNFKGKLYVGLDFEFFEGPILIGNGIITQIGKEFMLFQNEKR